MRRSSVIYYQHKARRKDGFYIRQHNDLVRSQGFPNAKGLALKFEKTSQRYYLFIIHPRHEAIVKKAIGKMLGNAWGKHFRML